MFSLPRIIARCLLALSILLVAQQAQATECKLEDNAPFLITQLPPRLTIPASVSDGAIIWESPQVDGHFLCRITHAGSNRVVLWLDPEHAPVPAGMGVYMRLGPLLFQVNGSRTQDTPIYLSNLPDGNHFVLNYSIVLVKQGTAPVENAINFSKFVVFEVGGADGPIRWPGGRRARHYLNGRADFSSGGTCALSSGDGRQSVRLPGISTEALPTVGSTAGVVRFSINLNNCSDTVQSARFIFRGTPASGDVRYFSNTGTATGIDLRLSDAASGQTITPVSVNNDVTVPVTNGQAKLTMMAEYVRTGEVTAGTLSSLAALMIVYQ